MLGRLADLGGFGLEAAPALIRNGLLGPVHPSALARVVEAYRHFHLTPATGSAAAAARWPDRPAVVDEAGTLTFAELDARAAALAAGLHRRLGAGPGRTVAVMWPNDRGSLRRSRPCPGWGPTCCCSTPGWPGRACGTCCGGRACTRSSPTPACPGSTSTGPGRATWTR
ncbi:AMP-binding protein [Nonomuraea thailandensis]